MFKKIIIGCTLLGGTSCLQAQFTLGAQIKPRTEFRDGFSTPRDSAQHHGLFTDQRTRLIFDYQHEGYDFRLSLQDIRVWGSQSQLNVTDGLTSLHEAWVKSKISENFGFKVGRQEIIYDDHRIFGNVEWAQQARSHDAGLFQYTKEGLKLDVGFAYNQNAQQNTSTFYNVPKSYKAFQYVWLKKKFNDQLTSSFLILNLGQQTSDPLNNTYWDNYNQTIGTHTSFKKNKLGIDFNGFYQMGKTADTKAKNISAFDIGLDINYKLNEKFTATLGYEILSGNSQTDTTKAYKGVQHAFNPYFGTNHKFNGYMDYFYVGNHLGFVGLQDAFVKLKYAKDKKFVSIDFHYFQTAANIWDVYAFADDLAAGNATPQYKAMSSDLGMEIDLTAGFEMSKGVSFESGFSVYSVSNSLAFLKGNFNAQGKPYIDGLNTWAYVMLVVKPELFSNKAKSE